MNKFNFLVAFLAVCTLSGCHGMHQMHQMQQVHQMQQIHQLPSSCESGHSGHEESGHSGHEESGHSSVINDGPIGSSGSHLSEHGWHGMEGLSGLSNLEGLGGSSGLSESSGHHLPHIKQAHRVTVHEQSKPLEVVAKGTHVVVNHPHLEVSAKPVVVKRKPDMVVAPIIVHKQLPPVKIQQLYMKTVQPIQKVMIQKALSHDIKESSWVKGEKKVLQSCHSSHSDSGMSLGESGWESLKN